MKVLVIGSGGREHAIVWKIAQSKLQPTIFCAPGNGGIADIATCIDIKADDVRALCDFAKVEHIDLTVVGPEAPLALGIVDEFTKHSCAIFGPSKAAAALEGSKVFAKEFMARWKVSTADFKVFTDAVAAHEYIARRGVPCVVKADGLAAGKGVVVAENLDEAHEAVAAMMEKKTFGIAGSKVIIEDCLVGEEASIIAIVDAHTVMMLASSQDHKRVFDDDKGPNTGGMGAYSPAPMVSEEVLGCIHATVIEPIIRGLRQDGVVYRGVLYAGIMLTAAGPQVLEFNVRFGDPETQAILPRLKSDLLEIMRAAAADKLAAVMSQGLVWDHRACVCVVCASEGYPGDYLKGKIISGLTAAATVENSVVFHAGTKREAGSYLTTGGRVLGVTALGENIKEAIAAAYSATEKIHFDGMHYRRDIGKKALLERLA
ncbi:MAG: phosphoribosylamine--glycine ligase [Candidatus Omnitrophota bacterium]